MINSVTLLGSSSGRNAGDAALIDSIMDSVDQACGEQLLYEIPTINPNFVWKTYSNRIRPISVMPWNLSLKLFGLPTYQSVTRTDISLIFDATLFDRSLYNPMFNFLSSYWVLLPYAKKKGKKMGFFNVTAGPVSTPMGRRMLREVSEMMDFITVRDQGSYDILMDLGVKNPNIIVTADAALNTRSAAPERAGEILRKLGFDEGEEILAININKYRDTWAGLNREPMSKETFMGIFAEGVNRIVQEAGVSVLFVSTQHVDEELTRELMARTRPARKMAMISNRDYSHNEIKAVLGKMSLLVAMRLHCMILASSNMCPIVSLNYLPKNQHYLDSLGLGSHAMGFDNFNVNDFVAKMRTGWEQRQQTKIHLQKRIPELQAEAHKSGQIVAALRRGEDAGSAIRSVSTAARQHANG